MSATKETTLDDDFGDDGYRVDPLNDGEPEEPCAFQVGDHVELARELIRRVGDGSDVVFDEMSPFRYEPTRGLWLTIDRADESRIVQGYSGAHIGSSGKPLKVKASDVSGSIALAHDQMANAGFFANGPSGIPFSNGFLRVSADGAVLEPHAKEHRARAGYPFAYERFALPRRFLEFLAALFRDDEDRCEKESFVQEFFGACMLGIAPTYQRCVIGIGKGDNGKSKLADGMLACMPAGTTSAIPPQEWGNEYRRAMLVGKRLNAVGELPEREIIASESFKAIVAGDPIVGRIIRESPAMYRPIAGHYFAANNLPGTPDQSDGFWRRFVVLTFNRSFKGDPTRDPQIIERILTEELPVIVSWLIEGAVRLMRCREYTIPGSHHAALVTWRRSADQVALFVESETRPLAPQEPLSNGIFAAELYASYRRWCESNGHRAMASNKLGARMHDLGIASTKTKFGWRYPIAMMTAADRARVTNGDTRVTNYPAPESCEVASA